jgi:hypothetical protein
MPGMIFWSFITCTKDLPELVFWNSVSSNRIAPEMYWPRPGVVSSSSRYARRLSSVFSTPMESRRLPQVALDSSMARMPRPGDATALQHRRGAGARQACSATHTAQRRRKRRAAATATHLAVFISSSAVRASAQGATKVR